MLNGLLKLILGSMCGYLFVKWFPIDFTVSLSDMIVEFVLDPLGFFASSIVFLVSFICMSDIMKQGAKNIYLLMKKQTNSKHDIVNFVIGLGCFYFLSTIGFLQTLLIFCFSVIYGIISLDFNRINEEKS